MAIRPYGSQFDQLTMFEPASALRGGGVGKFLPEDRLEIEDTDVEPDEGEFYEMREESDDEAWDRKAEEASDSGLTDHIAVYGKVARPVDLHVGDGMRPKGTIMNGHHRIAGQYDVDPKAEVPVSWTDRHIPGSEGRKRWPGDRTGPLTGPQWSYEHEAEIGYEKQGW